MTRFSEYDEEKVMRGIRADAFADGKEEGLEEGLEQGREEGLEQGIIKGNEERARSDALRMSEDGLSAELIARYTDEDIETFRVWLSESSSLQNVGVK